MKIIFFGSSEFSIAALKACRDSGHTVVLAITTPDQKKGRGLKECPTPVRLFCDRERIPVAAPVRLSDVAVLEKVKELAPEVFVVSSYGKLIPPAWLAVPTVSRLNVHPSLLPKYRGAAPINWAILNGDTETGVSIIDITDELDAGDIFHQITVPLDPWIDAAALSVRLAEVSAQALSEVLRLSTGGTLIRTPQDPQQAVYARKLEKTDGHISWAKSADQIHNMVRGLTPWPTAFFDCGKGLIVQVLKSRVVDPSTVVDEPGNVVAVSRDGVLQVQTGCGILGLERVRPSGKREMTGSQFANGLRLQKCSRLEKL